MRAILFIALILSQTLASKTQFEQVFTQIRESAPHLGFAKEITGLLELKMMDGSAVDEVLELISDLLQKMQQDQQMEESDFLMQLGQLNSDVETLEHTVENLSAQLKAVNIQIGDVNNEIYALTNTQNSLNKQLKVLNGKEEDIRSGRNFDQKAFEERQNSNNRAISALNQIIDKLSQAVFAEQGKASVFTEVHRKSLLETLSQDLGPSHPVTVLVSLTTQFDVPTVTRIIERMENIRDSMMKSLVSDQESEVEAGQQYETVIQEVVDVRERLAADVNTNRSLLNRRQNERVIAERTKAQLERDLPKTQELLSDTRNQREVVESTYHQRKHQRQQEIGVLQQAFTLISQQSDRIKASS